MLHFAQIARGGEKHILLPKNRKIKSERLIKVKNMGSTKMAKHLKNIIARIAMPY
jgi:hypothetical protein